MQYSFKLATLQTSRPREWDIPKLLSTGIFGGMRCSYKNCPKAATFYQPIHWFKEGNAMLAPNNLNTNYKIPLCEDHKREESLRFEEIELIDSDELPGIIIKVRDFLSKECKHRQVEVDDIHRTAQCTECGKWLDPMAVLLEVAQGLRSDEHRINAIAEADRKKKADLQRRHDLRAGREARKIGISVVKNKQGCTMTKKECQNRRYFTLTKPHLQIGWCAARQIQTEATNGLILKTPSQTIWCPQMDLLP